MAQEFIEQLFRGSKFSQTTRKYFRYFLVVFWLISIAFLFWSGLKNWNQIAPQLKNADLSPMGLAVAYYLVALGCAILLWLTIMRAFDRSLAWTKNFQIYAATFAARRLPGTLWYIGGRMLLYQKMGVAKSTIVFASALELVSTYATAGIVGLSAVFLAGRQLPAPLTIAIVIVTAAGLLLVYPAVINRLAQKNRLTFRVQAGLVNWLIWLIIALLLWIFGGLMVAQMVKVLQPGLSSADHIYVVGAFAISGLAGLLTYLLPSSFGATELSLTLFLAQVLPLPLAGAAAIAARIFTIVMEFVFSLLFYPVILKIPAEMADSKEGI